jgi:hypothetical protein
LFPAVGLESQGAIVRANFGDKAFRYNIGGSEDKTRSLEEQFEVLQVAEAS